ncbi:phosphogluconate dehydrogenase (NAD(+)-dependent, decarboxylating) [Clavibacter michiganensis]|uniref:6-phosphogluconate dehydrogenase n=1 Tax=Clavibacter michiganensis subsp. insidiosus TaxID=33014 RepID=A0A0D5CEP4_9MICO|nr:decarboxylating 6-phosphogluconate dehydrogenase [Clavibacter michiganensis]AJW77765.1 6-phosphogluconate dehydrogenase [Clavibacter michiganensis subsp. insidiosus]AWF96886.1 6-phosphogluconate dehydrogenase [Clavibacter michiganensis subsp. insidiosus]AWF99980.1 6-phosphogluconate dehydrogenase [Clavibacter michiganensis subsp. insidiosus]OQJ58677.1 6-phosphogluconate dehydrogenase (decarboxylating) [Clavibacter michiganensis subsp. insidiosus]RII88973.1 decarboxylating 6-phosphogluconate
MHIGLVGLGKMGARMRARLEANGIEVTGYDTNPDVSDVATLDDLAAALPTPRLVWVMVPAGKVTQNVVGDLARILEPGDLVIDGGNSKFTDDFAHAGLLKDKGIDFVDAGVSGGVWGLENGYGLMVGGPVEQVQRAMPVFDALRPEGPREEGFVHVGDSGAGHYAKMVHNGIEYAMMQSFAEGYELLAARKDIIKDVTGTFEAWQRGTVVRSWLLELLVKALKEDPGFQDIEGFVQDSGEGRWTIEEALDNAVPMPAISASIFARFSSRQEDSPAMKAVAALRNQFGGHSVQKKS